MSPVGIVDEGGAEGDGAGPGDGLRGGEHGEEVETELGQAEAHHDQGGRGAGELLHVREHPAHWLESGGLLAAQPVLLDHLWNEQIIKYCNIYYLYILDILEDLKNFVYNEQ